MSAQSTKSLPKTRLSWILFAVAGILIAIASLLFDALRFDLLTSGDMFSAVPWLLLSLTEGPFAYVLLSLIAGMSSSYPKEASLKSLVSLGFALLTYYILSIGLGIRPPEAISRFLFQAVFWCVAAIGLSLIMAPLACKMTDKNFAYRQAASGMAASLLGAPYWYLYLTTYSDGLFQLSLLVPAVIPVLFLVYRLRYKGYLQLALSVILTSILAIVGMTLIYQLSY